MRARRGTGPTQELRPRSGKVLYGSRPAACGRSCRSEIYLPWQIYLDHVEGSIARPACGTFAHVNLTSSHFFELFALSPCTIGGSGGREDRLHPLGSGRAGGLEGDVVPGEAFLERRDQAHRQGLAGGESSPR